MRIWAPRGIDWQVIEERTGGTARAHNVWSPVYVDALTLRYRDSDSNGTLDERLYVLQDANFNVTAIVDTSGSVVERYLYDPYGAVTYLTGSWGSRSASLYGWVYNHQGLRFVLDVGLIDSRARFLSPTLQRWVQQDPVWATNLYVAYGNGPVGRLDPSGQTEYELHGGAKSIRNLGLPEDPQKYNGGQINVGAIKGRIRVYPASTVAFPIHGQQLSMVIGYEGVNPNRVHFVQFFTAEALCIVDKKPQKYHAALEVNTTIGIVKFETRKQQAVTYLDVVRQATDPLYGPVLTGDGSKLMFDPPAVGMAGAKQLLDQEKNKPAVEGARTLVRFDTYVLVDKKLVYRILWDEETTIDRGKIIGISTYKVTGGGMANQLLESQRRALDERFPDQQAIEP